MGSKWISSSRSRSHTKSISYANLELCYAPHNIVGCLLRSANRRTSCVRGECFAYVLDGQFELKVVCCCCLFVVAAVVVCSSNYIELPVELLCVSCVDVHVASLRHRSANNWLSEPETLSLSAHMMGLEWRTVAAFPVRAACLSVSSQRVVWQALCASLSPCRCLRLLCVQLERCRVVPSFWRADCR